MSNWRVQLVGLYSVMRKEVARVFRIWQQTLLPPIITAILYFIIFGKVIGSHLKLVHGFHYMTFITPGLVFMPMVVGAYINTSSSFFGAKFGRHIEELLVSPLSNALIALGYILAGMVRGLFVSALVIIVAGIFNEIEFHHWPHYHSIGLMLVFVLLTTMLFAITGLINGVYAKTFDDTSFIPTFILAPLNYFGGVFYAISMLPPFWQFLSKFNPVVYLMNIFRYAFLGLQSAHIWWILAAECLLVLVLFLFAVRLMRVSQGLRS